MTVYTGRSVQVIIHPPAYVGRAVTVKLAGVKLMQARPGGIVDVRPATFVDGVFTWLGPPA